MVHRLAALAFLEVYCEILRPITDILSQNLHFNKGFRWFVYTLNLRSPVLPQTPGMRLKQKPNPGKCVSKACAFSLMPRCHFKYYLDGVGIPALHPPIRNSSLEESWTNLVNLHQLPGLPEHCFRQLSELVLTSCAQYSLSWFLLKVERSIHILFPAAQNHLMRIDKHPYITSKCLRETW